MPTERSQQILERMQGNEDFRRHAMGFDQWVMGNQQTWRAASEKMSAEDYWFLTDVLSAVQDYRRSEQPAQRAARGAKEGAKKQLGVWPRALTAEDFRWGEFGGGLVTRMVEKATFGAARSEPYFEKIQGPPQGIVWPPSGKEAAWKALDVGTQARILAEKHRPGELVYLPTQQRRVFAEAGGDIGSALGVGSWFVGPGGLTLGAARRGGMGLVGRLLGPQVARRAVGRGAGLAAEGLVFGAGEALGGYGAGEAPIDVLKRGAADVGTFVVMGKVIETAGGTLGKYMKGAPQRLWQAARTWATRNPQATQAEAMGVAKRMVRDEIKRAHPSIRGLLRRQWEEAETNIIYREPPPIRPRFFNERAAVRDARQAEERYRQRAMVGPQTQRGELARGLLGPHREQAIEQLPPLALKASPGSLRAEVPLPEVMTHKPVRGLRAFKEKMAPPVKRMIRWIDAGVVSSLDHTMRTAPVRRPGMELATALNEARLEGAMFGADALKDIDTVMGPLGKHGRGRVWQHLRGKLDVAKLSRQERSATERLRRRFDDAVIEGALNGAAPVRLLRDVEELGMRRTSEAVRGGTGIHLDRQAYTAIARDGDPYLTVSVRDLVNADEIAVVTSAGQRMRLPRDAVSLPMLEDYFPQYILPGVLQKRRGDIIKHLVQTGQATDEAHAVNIVKRWERNRGNVNPLPELWRHRQYDLREKWLVPAEERYARYMMRTWMRSMQTKHLGVEGSNISEWLRRMYLTDEAAERTVAQGLARNLDEARGHNQRMHRAVDSAIQRQLGNWQDDWLTGAARALRSYHAAAALWGVAITNAPQFANAAAITSNKAFSKAVGTAMTRMGREEAARSGALFYQGWLEAVGLPWRPVPGTAKGEWSVNLARNIVSNWYKLGPMERSLRTVSALAGKYHADDMAAKLLLDPGNAAVRKELQVLALKPEAIIKAGKLTPIMRRRAMQTVANRSQFLSQPQDLPLLFSTEWGRLLLQYKTFIYQQTRLMYNLWEKGDAKQKARLLALIATVYPALGEVAESGKAVLAGRERTGVWINRVIQAFAASAAFGLAMDMYERAAVDSRVPDLFDAPVLSTANDVASLLGHAAEEVHRPIAEAAGEPAEPESRKQYRRRGAYRTALRLFGYPGQLAARHGVPYYDVSDIEFTDRLGHVLQSNIPGAPAFLKGVGKFPYIDLPLTSPQETARSWRRLQAKRRETTWARATAEQRLKILQYIRPDDAARVMRNYMKPEDMEAMRDALTAGQRQELAAVIEWIMGEETERALEAEQKKRAWERELLPAP